jgi:hypothetical protein
MKELTIEEKIKQCEDIIDRFESDLNERQQVKKNCPNEMCNSDICVIYNICTGIREDIVIKAKAKLKELKGSDMDIILKKEREKTIHYLKALHKNSSQYQPEVRQAISYAIKIVKDSIKEKQKEEIPFVVGGRYVCNDDMFYFLIESKKCKDKYKLMYISGHHYIENCGDTKESILSYMKGFMKYTGKTLKDLTNNKK